MDAAEEFGVAGEWRVGDVVALDLGEDLPIEVVVIEIDRTLGLNVAAPALPPWQGWNEVIR